MAVKRQPNYDPTTDPPTQGVQRVDPLLYGLGSGLSITRRFVRYPNPGDIVSTGGPTSKSFA